MVNPQSLANLIQQLKFPKLKSSKASLSGPRKAPANGPSLPGIHAPAHHPASGPEPHATDCSRSAPSGSQLKALKGPLSLEKVHRFGKNKPQPNEDNERGVIIVPGDFSDEYHYLLLEDKVAESNRDCNKQSEEELSISAKARGNMSKLSNLWDDRHLGACTAELGTEPRRSVSWVEEESAAEEEPKAPMNLAKLPQPAAQLPVPYPQALPKVLISEPHAAFGLAAHPLSPQPVLAF